MKNGKMDNQMEKLPQNICRYSTNCKWWISESLERNNLEWLKAAVVVKMIALYSYNIDRNNFCEMYVTWGLTVSAINVYGASIPCKK